MLATVMRLCVCSVLLLLGGVAGSAVLSNGRNLRSAGTVLSGSGASQRTPRKGLSQRAGIGAQARASSGLEPAVFPDTVWAKRAGLLSGVLSIEPNPAAAIPFLRGAQQDLPVLDDYLRLWIAQAHLNLGETKGRGAPGKYPDGGA